MTTGALRVVGEEPQEVAGEAPLPAPELAALRRSHRSLQRQARALAEGLDEAQLGWRPAPESWSIGEHLDHLSRTSELYLEAIDRALAEARERARTGDGSFRLGLFERWFVALLEPPPKRRLKAPAAFMPAARAASGAASGPSGDELDRFLALQEQVIERLAATGRLDPHRIRVVSPVSPLLRLRLGAAFAVLAAHARRHLWHGRRIKQDERFPAAAAG